MTELFERMTALEKNLLEKRHAETDPRTSRKIEKQAHGLLERTATQRARSCFLRP